MREILDPSSSSCEGVVQNSDNAHEQAVRPSFDSAYTLAFKDIVDGVKSFRIWMFLAWQDVSLRYRRTFLGPFWLTVNMAITVYAIGFLYGRLFRIDLTQYYPVLAAGLLSWNLMSVTITDFVKAFSGSKDYIAQIKLPYFVYILRVSMRNAIIFLHNILVFVPIIFVFKVPLTLSTLLLIPSLILIFLFGTVYGLFLGVMGARFRDLSIVIGSIVHIAFFMTPVLWETGVLPERYRYLINFNPLAQIIELIRYPMLGKVPSLFALTQVVGILILGCLLSFYVFARNRKQIIYWL